MNKPRYQYQNKIEPKYDQRTNNQERIQNFKPCFFGSKPQEQGHTLEGTECEKPKIINLTCKQLQEEQIEILSKGLKFTPTPQKPNYNKIQDDISKFNRMSNCLTKIIMMNQ